jgi:hypothetical protein
MHCAHRIGRIEKMVPTDMLVSIFEEPSSGSTATASHRRFFQLIDDNVVGPYIQFGLGVAIPVLAAASGQVAGQRAQGDDFGNGATGIGDGLCRLADRHA